MSFPVEASHALSQQAEEDAGLDARHGARLESECRTYLHFRQRQLETGWGVRPKDVVGSAAAKGGALRMGELAGVQAGSFTSGAAAVDGFLRGDNNVEFAKYAASRISAMAQGNDINQLTMFELYALIDWAANTRDRLVVGRGPKGDPRRDPSKDQGVASETQQLQSVLTAIPILQGMAKEGAPNKKCASLLDTLVFKTPTVDITFKLYLQASKYQGQYDPKMPGVPRFEQGGFSARADM